MVLKVKYSIGNIEQPIREASYTILSGGSGSGGGSYTNETMIEDWADTKSAANYAVETNFNGGCTLVVQVPNGSGGCKKATGFGDLDKLDKWYYICNNGNSVNAISGSPGNVPAVPAACNGEGHVVQGLFTEGLGGRTDFIFSDYEYVTSGGGALISSGHTVGHFDINSDGGMGTDEGEQIVISGLYDGTINSSTVVDNKVVVGGFYVSSCSNSGCSTEPSTYLISPGPIYTLFEPGESSCTKPWFVIQNAYYNLCVTRAPGANDQDLLYSTCTGIPNQQWQVEPVTTSQANNDFTFELSDGSGCLTMTSDLLFKYSSSATCALADPTQIWFVDNVSAGNPISYIKTPFNQYGDNKRYCMNAQFLLGPTTTPLLAACNGADQSKWTFLPNGALPATNPLDIE